MVEWLTILFDSRIFMKVNAGLGFLFLGFFVFFYFSKEGRDERGRGLIATASLIAFAMLFVLATMVTPPKKGGDRPMRRPTPKLQWEGTGLSRHCLSYPRSFWQTVSRPSHCGVRFAQVEKRTTTHTRVTKQAEWQWAAAGAG